MANLTDAAVRKLEAPEKGITTQYEGAGFGVRVTPAGVKSFVLRYRVGKLQRLYTIGPYPAWSVAQARTEANRLRQLIGTGADPLASRQHKRVAETMEELGDTYIKEHAKPKKRTWRTDERRIAKYVTPAMKGRRIEDITRRDVSALVNKVAKTAPIEANRLLALVRKMFSFAVDNGLIENHPCLRMSAPSAESAGSRALTSPAEIKAFWEATDTDSREHAALRLLLLTGARVSEVAELPWAEIDLETGDWALPAARHKGKRDHLVPLPADALAIVKARPREPKALHVFGGRKDAPMRAKRVEQALHDLTPALAKVGVAPLTPHALRRTVETGMASIGVAKEYRDRVLGHKDASVGAVHYNKHDYKAEKRNALEAWANHVRKAIGAQADNIIPFTAKAG